VQEIIAATISLSRSFQTPTCGTYVNKDIYSERGHSLDHWQTTLNDLLFTSADLTLASSACKLALNPGTENGSCQNSFLTIAYMCEKKRKQAPICLMFFQCLSWMMYLSSWKPCVISIQRCAEPVVHMACLVGAGCSRITD